MPSDSRDHAGGDWYDAFRLADGRFGIVIGDVGGRGMTAAATMGQVRNALRAYALKGASPDEVIDDLHRLVDAAGGEITFVTVVYVVLDPATGEGELALAGHLPPLIVGAQRTEYLDAPRCPPLGFSGAGPCTAGTLRRSDPARRCGSTPTVSSSPAGARSTSAWARWPRPPAAPPGRWTRSPITSWSRCRTRATTTSRCSGYADSASCVERVAQDPRDVHLRDPDALGDLALHEILDEAQPQHLALARGEVARDLLEPDHVLDALEPAVLAAELVAERAVGGVLAQQRARRGWPGATHRPPAAPP